MAKKRTTWRPWGDHPIIVVILVIAALIPIYLFVKNEFRHKPESITIHVSDQSGSPVLGAKTLAFSPNGSLSGYTDSNGISELNIEQIGWDAIRLIVEADDYQIYEQEIQSVGKNAIDIRLEPSSGSDADVILRTVRKDSSEPVSNLELVLVSRGDIFRQVTDSDGFAVFTLTFPNQNKMNALVSVSSSEFEIENQLTTLVPDRLQYVVLSPRSLSVEAPNISSHSTITLEGSVTEGLVEVGSGINITQSKGTTGLQVALLDASGRPWENVYIEVFEQIPDIVGEPSLGNRIATGRINKQGIFSVDGPQGMYAICPSEAPGYGWSYRDCIFDVLIDDDAQTVVQLQVGLLEIALIYATGEPWEGTYYEVYTQTDDVVGNPALDNRVANGRTDNSGHGRVSLTPGMYSVVIDLPGYEWGNLVNEEGEADIGVSKGDKSQLVVEMGRLVIGLSDISGQPSSSTYVELYTQTLDINGNPVLAERIWGGRPDNRGFCKFNLTEGLYALRIGETTIFDIPVDWGKVTERYESVD